MIIQYIQTALRKAHYEFIDDGKIFFGSVPELKGVWADGKTLEECRDTLAEVIEDWIWAHIRRGMDIREIDGVKVEPDLHTVLNVA